MKWLVVYLAAALAFGLLDFLWLRRAGPGLYRPVLGDALAERLSLAPTLVYYLIYIAAIVWFAVVPGMTMGVPVNALGWVLPGVFAGIANAVLNGALLGIVAYSAYGLANQASLRTWPAGMTAIGIAWGASATALASGLAALALRQLG